MSPAPGRRRLLHARSMANTGAARARGSAFHAVRSIDCLLIHFILDELGERTASEADYMGATDRYQGD